MPLLVSEVWYTAVVTIGTVRTGLGGRVHRQPCCTICDRPKPAIHGLLNSCYTNNQSQ